jgi:hypothetical protein
MRLLFCLFLATNVWAQATDGGASTAAKNKTMDFEDDVIEGSTPEPRKTEGTERLSSPIFMDLHSTDASVDSIIFRRANFNDFHNSDRKTRLHMQPTSTAAHTDQP